MVLTINLYDDEEADFFIRTNCPLPLFKKELNKYRKRKASEKYGYNYDDFFRIIQSKDYFVEVIEADDRIYF
jgi:hypothetical protein